MNVCKHCQREVVSWQRSARLGGGIGWRLRHPGYEPWAICERSPTYLHEQVEIPTPEWLTDDGPTLHDGEHDDHIRHPHYGGRCMVSEIPVSNDEPVAGSAP